MFKRERSRTEEASIYAAYAELLRDVEKNRQDFLNHVLLSEISDRSKPFLPSSYAVQQNQRSPAQSYPFHARRQVNAEIKCTATLQTLNHVSIRHDSSAPLIPNQVKDLLNNDRKKLVEELQKIDIKSTLHHASEVSDRSTPIIPETVDLTKTNPMKQILKEVKSSSFELSPTDPSMIKDRSAPIIEAGISSM